MTVRLNPEVTIEAVGDGFLVLSEKTRHVVQISGQHAACIRQLIEGRQPEDIDAQALRELAEWEIIETRASQGINRRQLVGLGLAGTTTAMTVLALPSVAAASSAVFPFAIVYWQNQDEGAVVFFTRASVVAAGWDDNEETVEDFLLPLRLGDQSPVLVDPDGEEVGVGFDIVAENGQVLSWRINNTTTTLQPSQFVPWD